MNRFKNFLLAGVAVCTFACNQEPSMEDQVRTELQSADFWSDTGTECDNEEAQALNEKLKTALANGKIVVVSDVKVDDASKEKNVYIDDHTTFKADVVGKDGKVLAHLFYENTFFQGSKTKDGGGTEVRSFIIEDEESASRNGVSNTRTYVVPFYNNARTNQSSQCMVN